MRHTISRRRTTIILTLGLAAGLVAVSTSTAQAVEPADGGPIDLGTASTYSVLGAAAVTNTGDSVLNGDLGVSPGTSITGFPPGIVNGTTYAPPATEPAQAQADLTTAYGVAAGLTPVSGTYAELGGLSLTPGVYHGTNLSVTGELTLAGTAESVWVFQAAEGLTTASDSRIRMTGGASVCNVFWQVGSSATLGTGSHFVGTIMAYAAITATTGAEVDGRLLARVEAVTLDDNRITVSNSCGGRSSDDDTTPAITSEAPPGGVVGTPYTYTVTATGSPAPHYIVTSGSLPAGLSLDDVTGEITGTPTGEGTTTVTLTARNGTSPDATIEYTITIAAAPGSTTTAPLEQSPAIIVGTGGPSAPTAAAPVLAATGSGDASLLVIEGSGALVLGAIALILGRRRRASFEKSS